MKSILGRIIGAIVFVSAVAAIWLWPKKEAAAFGPDPVRPVRSVVVKDGTRMPDLEFPGVVKAGDDRTLAFEVPGRLISIPVDKNETVKAGDVIAKLDPKDFEDRVAKAKATLDRDIQSLARYRNVAENAVSKEEVSRAEAQVKTSQAEYDSAKRDLERTVLVAPFDGVIADTYPSELDVLAVGSKVALILDTREMGVEVSLPETIVIRSKMIEKTAGTTNISHVVFDSYPGRSFPARLDSFTAIADSRTQIYKATFKLTNVPELNLLPGMSATVTVNGADYVYRDAESRPAIAIPSSSVGVDEKGGYFVWRLEPAATGEGRFVARKSPVVVSSRVGEEVVVSSGVKAGERIATAGVTLIEEGREVTLLKEFAR